MTNVGCNELTMMSVILILEVLNPSRVYLFFFYSKEDNWYLCREQGIRTWDNRQCPRGNHHPLMSSAHFLLFSNIKIWNEYIYYLAICKNHNQTSLPLRKLLRTDRVIYVCKKIHFPNSKIEFIQIHHKLLKCVPYIHAFYAYINS